MQIEDMNVLVVDDHMIMRSLLRQHLISVGIKNIAESPNGSEALHKIQQAQEGGTQFNAILADWSMPVMDGLTFLKKIREDSRLGNVAFVMITAESEKGRMIEALQAGATSYIIKPFSQESLLEHMKKIQDWLKARLVK